MTWCSVTTWLFLGVLLFPQVSASISTCNQTCTNSNDCSEQLLCSNNICSDDPNFGTQLCSTGDTLSSSCNQTCDVHTDCPGELGCFDNKCNDDPFLPTQICGPNDGCKIACETSDDCPGKLICNTKKQCNDDPALGTHICGVDTNIGGDNRTSGGIAPNAGVSMEDCPTATPSCLSSSTSSAGTLLTFEHVGTWKIVTSLFFGPTSGLCVFLLIM